MYVISIHIPHPLIKHCSLFIKCLVTQIKGDGHPAASITHRIQFNAYMSHYDSESIFTHFGSIFETWSQLFSKMPWSRDVLVMVVVVHRGQLVYNGMPAPASWAVSASLNIM